MAKKYWIWSVAGVGLLMVLLFGFGIVSFDGSELGLFLGRFHPVVVHLPIGLLLLAAVLEAASRRPRFGNVQPAVPLVLGLGAASAVVAVAAGFLLALSGGYDESTLYWHKRLGIGVAVAATAACILKLVSGRYGMALLRRAYVAVLTGMIGLLAVGSHLGGSLTHGSDYLTRYMPEMMRVAMALPPRAEDGLATIESIEEAVIYTDLIRPILASRCVACHSADKIKGDLRLDAPEGLLEGGESGPALVPEDALESEMVRRILLPPEHDDHMPPQGRTPLTVSQAELIRWWIDQGASFEQKVSEAETTPEIDLILAAYTVKQKRGVFALKVEPADPVAVDSLRGLGVSVMQVAGEESFLQVACTNVAGMFGDEQMRLLRPLAEQITWLDLSGTGVTNAGLAVLRELPHLSRLHLERTAVGDSGLAHLRGLGHLEYLNLYGTNVGDAGLEHLAASPKLKRLYLWQTRATDAGVRRLQQAAPDLYVSLGMDPDAVRPDTSRVTAASPY